MKLPSLLVLFSLCLCNRLSAQPSLVKDIDNGVTSTSALEPSNFVIYKNLTYYSDRDSQHGLELWVTDGTTEGTRLFKDISPGVSPSNPGSFIEMNGILYFVACDAVSGTELWRTDGSVEGTFLVKDINPGGGGSFAHSFTAVGNILYLVAYHQEFGEELWRSDGTPAGTSLVKDINPGIQSCRAYYLANLNGILLFNAKDEHNGEELWRSDGTAEGTRMVKDIIAGGDGSRPLYLTVFKGRVYFVIETATSGESSQGKQIWMSDGTAEGTSMFLSHEFDGRNNHYQSLLAGANHLYFTAFPHNGGTDTKLWMTDGITTDLIETSTDTRLSRALKMSDGNLVYYSHVRPDINDLSQVETHIIVIDDASGDVILDESYNYQLGDSFRSYISEIVKFSDDAFVWQLVTTNDHLFPVVSQPEVYGYLIKTQKNTGSTLINTSSYASRALSNLYNGKILFGAATGQHPDGASLYATDGTPGGTSILKSMAMTRGSNPQQLTVFRDKLLFAANSNSGLWISDGTGPGTLPVENDFTFTNIANVTAAGNSAFFSASTPSTGEELWKTDGTSSGTLLVKDFAPGSTGGRPALLTAIQNRMVYTVHDAEHGFSLWSTDGPTSTVIRFLSSPSTTDVVTKLTKNTSGDRIYFDINSPVFGTELWKTDGTAQGTMMVRNIVPGNGNINFDGLSRTLMINNILYFFVVTGSNTGLWRSDGTEAGTIKIKDFVGESYRYVKNMCRYGDNKFVFTNLNLELWSSDGSPEGTTKIKDFPFDIIDGNASGPELGSFITLGEKTFFFKGIELWETDGTTQGTKFVTRFDDYITIGYTGISQMIVFDERIFFSAHSQDGSAYLWSTDGTAAGTKKIEGVKNVGYLQVMNDVLYFKGEGAEGAELWKYVPEVTTSLEPESFADITVFPNPGTGTFTIAFREVSPVSKIELRNCFGRPVSYKIVYTDEKHIQVKIDQETAGMYFLSMQSGEQLIVRKVIRQ